MKYALLASRIAAYIIDCIIYFIFSYFLLKFGAGGYAVALLIFFLYRYITTAAFGATPGMMALKLKLINHSYKSCFLREITRIGAAFFYVGYIYAIFDKDGRAFHDAASDTFVAFASSDKKSISNNKKLKFAVIILTIIVSFRWGISFILNDIGLIGLKKIYTSPVYYQKFDGDDLLSLTQDELYMRTLGRKYVTPVDFDGKPYLVRVSNKINYTEIYKLGLRGDRIIGEYLFKIDIPVQYICSGIFSKTRDLCCVSPKGGVLFVNSSGIVYGRYRSSLSNILTLKCGDIDSDGKDEAVIMDRDGNIEVYNYNGKSMTRIYKGKFGEDIVPQTFYIDKGITAAAKSKEKIILNHYKFSNGKFIYEGSKTLKLESVTTIKKLDDDIIVSHISRNAMMVNRGKIQSLGVYNNELKRIYNFGERPGRRYDYTVRSLEDVYDIDSDGNTEIILKAVSKNDVMGGTYTIEIYRLNKPALFLNRILTKIESILFV